MTVTERWIVWQARADELQAVLDDLDEAGYDQDHPRVVEAYDELCDHYHSRRSDPGVWLRCALEETKVALRIIRGGAR